MSRFLDTRYEALTPYTPGEQPQNAQYIKLNTNELPFPPSLKAQRAAKAELEKLNLYPDPAARRLALPLAETLGVGRENIFLGNGSDEVLAFCFMALCQNGAAFADITYGFYKVYAALYGVDAKIIPLGENFSLNCDDYTGLSHTVFIANPNAPTGLALPVEAIGKLVEANPQSLFIIDEAYVDFGAQSAVPLTKTYDNLMVVGTFSKSRAMAGARLGYALAGAALITDLERIKYSFNPYNLNRVTMAAGAGALADPAYFEECLAKIIATRQRAGAALKSLGFEMTDSRANFLFVHHPNAEAEAIYTKLRQRGILARWFDAPRIRGHLRISVGTDADMDALVKVLTEIL